MPAADRLYLDHAATTPVLPVSRDAVVEGLACWANPSSPHADGRAARAMLEEARRRIAAALSWEGHVLFTSGATEAAAIALGRARVERIMVSAVEHDCVFRAAPDALRMGVDAAGALCWPDRPVAGTLLAVQHVNNETGVIQSFPPTCGGPLFVDCAQSAGKLALPDADMVSISAHKFGGPPGIGALLVRDIALLHPSGGQEYGYRGGTENMPAILGMAAALEAPRDWLDGAAGLRARLEAGIAAAGGEIVAADSPRIATIGSYRMPGRSARMQLIRFDMAGISVSAGSACSSGALKASHVLGAMGWGDAAASEVVRISFGPATTDADIDRFLAAWRGIAGAA